MFGDQKKTKADITFIEVEDIECRLAMGRGRVGLGSPSPLASSATGLPVVSSHPPPPHGFPPAAAQL